MVQPATPGKEALEREKYNRFEKWFNPQQRSLPRFVLQKYNRFEKWFNPQLKRES